MVTYQMLESDFLATITLRINKKISPVIEDDLDYVQWLILILDDVSDISIKRVGEYLEITSSVHVLEYLSNALDNVSTT